MIVNVYIVNRFFFLEILYWIRLIYYVYIKLEKLKEKRNFGW